MESPATRCSACERASSRASTAPLLALAAGAQRCRLVALYSASYGSAARVAAQLGNLGVALVAMWLVAQVPPQTLLRLAVPAYAARRSRCCSRWRCSATW